MLMFTCTISCLTTSNLPCFMDLTFKVPMKYCSFFFFFFGFFFIFLNYFLLWLKNIVSTKMQHCSYSIRLYFHHQTHPQLNAFPLWPSHFILSGAISSCLLLFTSSILDTSWPWGLIFWCHIFLPFYAVPGFFSWLVHWGGLPLPPPMDHILSELSNMTRWS